jgi:NAD(P)-dependent dehydrogenase (short-subunit alcohol dehydrogenase family)
MMSLEGKVAIVTGSSRGIGKAIALALAEEGVDIVAAARTTDANPVSLPGTVDTTAAEVRALGRRAIGVRMDLTKEEDIEEMMRKTLEEFGRVDILVNNAGISFNGTILELPVKRWDLVMNVNLRGAYLCCKAVLPKMVEQKSGSILNISSAASRGAGGRVSYGVSKAAMERLTVGLAAEVKENNIAVNAIALELPVASEGFIFVSPGVDFSNWEKPEIMGEAAVYVLTRSPETYTGKVVTVTELRKEYNSA